MNIKYSERDFLNDEANKVLRLSTRTFFFRILKEKFLIIIFIFNNRNSNINRIKVILDIIIEI